MCEPDHVDVCSLATRSIVWPQKWLQKQSQNATIFWGACSKTTLPLCTDHKALSKQQASPSSEEPDTYLLKTHLNQFMDKPPGLPNHGLSASPKHKQALAFRPDPLLTASYLTIYHTNLIHLNKIIFLNTGLSLSSKFLPPQQRKLHQVTC